MHDILTRKQFIKRTFGGIVTGLSTLFFLTACNEAKKSEEKVNVDPCNDFSKVTEDDLKAREKMGYVKVSPVEATNCNNCQLYLPFKETTQCGNCQLFKGPVEAEGHCTYWAPQVNLS